MKKARIIALAALVSVAMVSAANAGGLVWAQSGTNGGPGQTLNLTCDTTVPPPVRCEWVIDIFYQTDGYSAGGWMLDLLPDPGSIDKLTVKPGAAYGPSGPVPAGTPNDSANNNAFETNGDPFGDGYALIHSAGSLTTSPTNPGTHLLFSFLLSKEKLPFDNNTSLIFFRVGFNEWGGNDSNGYEIVGFGPNPPREGGYTGAPEDLPFIAIVNTPEPTTLALLGLGLVGLIRRRR